MSENAATNEPLRNEARWKAFHQTYDSAMRTWRRGPDVSRAVNWLYVVSREDASDRDREIERENRELGLKLGGEAQAEHEIAPLVWKAAHEGRLRTLADDPATFAAQGDEGVSGSTPGGSGSTPGGAGEPGGGAKGGSGGGDAPKEPSAPTPPSGDGGQKPPSAPPPEDDSRVIFPEGSPVEPDEPAPGGKPAPRPDSDFFWEYLI